MGYSPNNDNDELTEIARQVGRELKATSELIMDAAKLGKEELLKYVYDSMKAGSPTARRPAASGNDGTAAGASAGRPNMYTDDFYRRQQEIRSAQAANATPKKKRLRKVGAGSKALQILGGAGGLLGAIILLVAWDTSDAPMAVFGLLLAALGGLQIWGGIRKNRSEKRYKTILQTVGIAPCITLKRIAKLSGIKLEKVRKDVDDMVDRGYFGSAAMVDHSNGILYVVPGSPLSKEDKDMQAEAPDAAAPAQTQEAKAAPPRDNYDQLIAQLRTLNERIQDEDMSNRIYRIEAVVKATLLAVREHPEKKAQLQRFMDYYLPTTIRLLESYAAFEGQEVSTENIRKSKENIEKMMGTLGEAYETQFDSLFRTETMDLNAEIQAMDSLLRQDGLVGHNEMKNAVAAQGGK